MCVLGIEEFSLHLNIVNLWICGIEYLLNSNAMDHWTHCGLSCNALVSSKLSFKLMIYITFLVSYHYPAHRNRPCPQGWKQGNRCVKSSYSSQVASSLQWFFQWTRTSGTWELALVTTQCWRMANRVACNKPSSVTSGSIVVGATPTPNYFFKHDTWKTGCNLEWTESLIL